MARWPPVRTLIGFPYSDAVASLTIGGSFDAVRYPLSNLTDGSARRTWRSGWGNLALKLTLPMSRPANFLAIFGHNLDHTQVLAVSNNTGFLRGVGVKEPGFWLDLRDVNGTPATASEWTVTIQGNSRPVALNEVAVGLAEEFEGIIRSEYTEQVHGFQVRELLEYGKTYLSASGAIGRRMELALSPTVENRGALASIDATAMSTARTRRVVVCPDTLVNEAWYVDWPGYRPTTFPQSYLVTETSIELLEESMGVLRDVIP